MPHNNCDIVFYYYYSITLTIMVMDSPQEIVKKYIVTNCCDFYKVNKILCVYDM